MRTVYRRRLGVLITLLALLFTLAACNDDGGTTSAPAGGAEEEPASEGSEGDGDGADDDSDQPSEPPTGDARATVEIHGELYHLALVDGATNARTLECDINTESQNATVAGMVSPEGYEVQMFPSFGWAATVIEPDGTSWNAGAADPNPDADYSVEISEGRVIVDGRWGDPSGSTTTEIRMEILCP